MLSSEECPIHPAYKEAVRKAKSNDTVVTGRSVGAPVRILKNQMAREYLKREREGAEKMELEKYTLGSLRRAVKEGDVKNGSLMAGQVSGMIQEIRPVREILEQMEKEYEACMADR
jgi:enoyl-[acyl-carrier protein] reductase II